MMAHNQDWREWLSSWNASRAEYAIAAAEANSSTLVRTNRFG